MDGNSPLQGMIDRKQSIREIHQARNPNVGLQSLEPGIENVERDDFVDFDEAVPPMPEVVRRCMRDSKKVEKRSPP